MEVIYHNTDEASKCYRILRFIVQVRSVFKHISTSISRDVGHNGSQTGFSYNIWPDQEELQKTRTLCFRPTYGSKVVAITDCYEVKIIRPSNLVAKGSTWSQYKHSNTVKVLIAVAPQRVTTFVSESWGGRTSNKHLTLQSGLLKKFHILLADRGFSISEKVPMTQTSLQIPAFTKGMDQLSPLKLKELKNWLI